MIKPWLRKEWCIPPKQNAAFVCAMESILDVYKWPYNPEEPVVAMDETTKQLTAEVIEPIPPSPGQPERYDTHYSRNGVATIFLFLEALVGWRRVRVTGGKTRVDWALQIRELLDVHYPDAKKVHLVLDNLNTHDGASLYEAFPPREAKRLMDRLVFHYTPKHGSWLNVAEIELSALGRQCLRGRIPDVFTLIDKISAWESDRNNRSTKIDWRFTTENARVKLKRLYPVF